MKPAAIVCCLVLALGFARGAAAGDYGLMPSEVADGVYVLWGDQAALTPENGAAVGNSGFIVGDEAVLVIDCGPTRKYAEQQLAAIAAVTDRPVRHMVITHHHPDHAFGLSAYNAHGADTVMHRAAQPLLHRDGPFLLDQITTLVGEDWTEGTEIADAGRLIDSDETIDLGGRVVEIIAYANGHTPGDLVVLDRATGTLFAGDLVFVGRAATVPHADVPTWLGQLDDMAGRGWTQLIPGHGPAITEPVALAPLKDYLAFLEDHARSAIDRGETLAEAMEVTIPDRFRGLALIDAEFPRSMFALFEKYEDEGF